MFIRHDSHRGSALVVVLLFVGVIATLSSSLVSSTRLQLAQSRATTEGLRAELAAESGVEFALRQLRLDPAWDGTGADGVDLPGGGHFDVLVADAGNGALDLRIDGAGDHGAVHLDLSVEAAGSGSSTGDKAVIVLGEEGEFEHAHVHGSVLLADQFGSVADWHNNADGTGWWGGDGRDDDEFEYEFEWAHVHETLWKFTEQMYIGGGTDERVTVDVVKMPSWYLEDWIAPSPDVTILYDVTSLKNKHYHDPVVLVYTKKPGKHKGSCGDGDGDDISLTNCHFDKGLVVYTPWDTDTRDPEDRLGFEIEIEAKNCHFGTPHTNSLAVLAPGAEIDMENCINRGLVYGYEVEFENTNTWGVVIAIHELEIEHGQVFYDADVAQNPPPGVQLDNASNGVRLLSLSERYLQ
jgi:hypothetical protein